MKIKKSGSDKRKGRIALAMILGLVMSFVGILVWVIRRDLQSQRISCGTNQSQRRAALVLKALDTSTERVKTGLGIAGFDATTDTINIYTVTSRQANSRDYADVPHTEQSPNSATARTNDVKRWDVDIPYNRTTTSFLYPFDSYQLDLQIDAKRSERDMPLDLIVTNRISQTVIEKCLPAYSFDPTPSDTNAVHLVLRRHTFLQITFCVVYGMALLFLIYLFRRREPTSVLSSSLGYIVALWGIRNIIVGPINIFPTIPDVITLTLYIIVGAIFFYKWLLNSPLFSGPKVDPRSLPTLH